MRGQNRHITLAALDPSAADTAAGFTYTINWGDGTAVQTILPGQAVAPSHIYKTDNTFTITASVTDKDGGKTTTTRSIAITPVALEGTTLAIGGLTKEDLLVLTQTNGSGGLKTLNLIDNLLHQYSFNESQFNRIDVYQADVDLVFVAKNVSEVVYLVDANGNILETIHKAAGSGGGSSGDSHDGGHGGGHDD